MTIQDTPPILVRREDAYPAFSTPEAMAQRIKVDSEIWEQVIEDNDIRQ